mgnify:CR=1 FL=1
MELKDALFNDAENAGMTGIREARKLEDEAISMQKTFGNKFSETSLDKFQKLTAQQKRDLKTIEKFIGENFIDDLETITKDIKQVMSLVEALPDDEKDIEDENE